MSQTTIGHRPYVNSNLFSSHYLDERVRERQEWDCDEQAGEVLEELQSLYELEGEFVQTYSEDSLRSNWIEEVLEILGFGKDPEIALPDERGFVDLLLFEDTEARRDAAEIYIKTDNTQDLFEGGVGLVEAKQWDADFSRWFEDRKYRTASHQIKHYLDKTPENIQWGILTNGRKWRLYGTKDYESETYYEINLPELLEQGNLEAFKYFFVFFRPSAFRESAGTTFLDQVWSESETAAQKLGEDLQDNVFTALRVLGRGFIETNELEINPNDADSLNELKEQSLVLLYRLMFVLYAEAKGLIHPEGQRAKDEYRENFSLDNLRLNIHDTIGEVDEGFEEEYSEYSTKKWHRLEDLFRLIDEGQDDLGIPPYNGGLFDREEHSFLSENQVSDRYLTEVIYRLTTKENEEGRYVLADYADLDTRHLGSVYEGLLEHQFRIAPEKYSAVKEDGGQLWKPTSEVATSNPIETVPQGGLYVVNDQGERKATGAYYTPDYVVTYIVEETIGPQVNEIREDLIDQGFERGTHEYLGPFLKRVTDLQILDPAMGSGHFLTKATGYLAEQVMTEVREVEVELGISFDEEHVRREIAKECIYGVDLNGMAVELAKLSMWLETLAADRPLAFLDHHIKEGNSLIGSDLESIEKLESDISGGDEQYSLADFGATREGTIDRLMDIYGELLAIENQTVEDVREMKRKYAEIERDELRQRLIGMANVHTADVSGVNVPSGAYERMARAVENDADWQNIEVTDWFQTAERHAEEANVFHWRLEFPEVFYRQDGKEKSNPGFDAIIGNPPYVDFKTLPEEQKALIEPLYQSSTGKFDLFIPFIERGINLSSGKISYIVPSMFMKRDYGRGIRKFIVENASVDKVLDFKEAQIFGDATNFTAIVVLSVDDESAPLYHDYKPTKEVPQQILDYGDSDYSRVASEGISEERWRFITQQQSEILKKIQVESSQLQDVTKGIRQGLITSKDSVFLLTANEVASRDFEEELWRPLARGEDVERWWFGEPETRVFYPYDDDNRVFSEQELQQNFPESYEYLMDKKSDLAGRSYYEKVNKQWYELWRPREKWVFEEEKILVQEISGNNQFALDREGYYYNTKAFGILTDDLELEYLLGILNSKLLEFEFKVSSVPKRGGYYEYNTQFLEELSIQTNTPEESHSDIIEYVSKLISSQEELAGLNLNLLDYLGNYESGPKITDLDPQPSRGIADSILAKTTEDFDSLQIDEARVERVGGNITVSLTARFKPDSSEDYDTNQRGYTVNDPTPVMRFSDLSDTEADLIETFLPVAVEEADGFANFRENATKTISLVDRLRELTLPNPDDVEEDIQRFLIAKERANELEEEIGRLNRLIDEIVYDLYDLTDEEIKIVEDSIANSI